MKLLSTLLLDRGDMEGPGKCMVRVGGSRIYATYHPDAPIGVSLCGICDRLVVRGLGRWWGAS